MSEVSQDATSHLVARSGPGTLALTCLSVETDDRSSGSYRCVPSAATAYAPSSFEAVVSGCCTERHLPDVRSQRQISDSTECAPAKVHDELHCRALHDRSSGVLSACLRLPASDRNSYSRVHRRQCPIANVSTCLEPCPLCSLQRRRWPGFASAYASAHLPLHTDRHGYDWY